MTMIEVQSTRNGSAKEAQAPQEVLRLTGHDRKSNAPITLGFLLVSLGLYIKTSFLGEATANVPKSGLPSEDPPSQAPSDSVVGIEQQSELQKALAQENDMHDEVLGNHAKKVFTRIFFDPSDPAMQRSDLYFPVFTSVDGNAATIYRGNSIPSLASPFDNDNTAPRPVAKGGDAKGEKPPENSDEPDNGSGDGSGNGGPDGGNDNTGGGPGPGVTDVPKVNRRPQVTASVTLYDAYTCMAVMIAISDLLRNASDPDGDPLSVRNVRASSGNLEVEGNDYRLLSHHEGSVTLTYEVTDGSLAVEQTATINLVKKPVILGTDHNDVLLGTACEDEIDGKSGDDRIDAWGGDDVVDGGAGADHIVGGMGDDVLFGGDGDDVIFGDSGNDVIFGGAGEDRIFGGDGDDTLLGDEGNDTIFADAGNDIVSGGRGSDILHDGSGNDAVSGDEGDDTIVAAADNNDDSFDGGDGTDIADFSASQSNLVFDMAAKTVVGADVGTDTVTHFEIFTGGSGNDTFKAVASPAPAPSAVANETHADAPFAVMFAGGEGVDTVDLSAATASIVVDMVNGIASGDTIETTAFTDVEEVIGGSGDDTFIIGAGAVSLDGRAGNDLFAFLTDTSVSVSASHHAIDNFEVGDVIRMSRYDIFEHVVDAVEGAFQDIYGNTAPHTESADSVIPIRIRNEIYDDGSQKSFVDADFNDDQQFEVSIELGGAHHLTYTLNNLA